MAGIADTVGRSVGRVHFSISKFSIGLDFIGYYLLSLIIIFKVQWMHARLVSVLAKSRQHTLPLSTRPDRYTGMKWLICTADYVLGGDRVLLWASLSITSLRAFLLGFLFNFSPYVQFRFKHMGERVPTHAGRNLATFVIDSA